MYNPRARAGSEKYAGHNHEPQLSEIFRGIGMGWCARTEVELGSSAGRVGGYNNGKELRGCGLVRRYLQAKRGGWFTDAGYQPPLALCANPHGPRDPNAERILLTYRSSAGYRRSDEGDGAQGNRQHGYLDEGSALFQIRSASGRPFTILDNGRRRRTGWFSEPFAVGSRGPSGVRRPRGSPSREWATPGLAHQRQVGLFSHDDASGRGLEEPTYSGLRRLLFATPTLFNH
jgi:hypothetical protein